MDQKQAHINRENARKMGDKTYHGQTCKNFPSHGGKRYTNSASCVKCQSKKNGRSGSKRVPVRACVVEPYTPEQQARLDQGALKFYGDPCANGHDGLRYTRDASCVDCSRERSAANRPPAGLTKAERWKWKRQKRIARTAASYSAFRAILSDMDDEFTGLLG